MFQKKRESDQIVQKKANSLEANQSDPALNKDKKSSGTPSTPANTTPNNVTPNKANPTGIFGKAWNFGANQVENVDKARRKMVQKLKKSGTPQQTYIVPEEDEEIEKELKGEKEAKGEKVEKDVKEPRREKEPGSEKSEATETDGDDPRVHFVDHFVNKGVREVMMEFVKASQVVIKHIFQFFSFVPKSSSLNPPLSSPATWVETAMPMSLALMPPELFFEAVLQMTITFMLVVFGPEKTARSLFAPKDRWQTLPKTFGWWWCKRKQTSSWCCVSSLN